MQLDRLLSTRQAADVIGVSVTTLKRMRYADLGPTYTKIGARTYRYRAADIEDWIRDRRCRPQEAGPEGGLHA
ncbi:helix-turn-helix transcriptional regulator [Ruegeria sp. HKCCA5426]|uniref:helix-turn-helix transcriptional regulator n=1 Tax=Ruegeria sp. HKCCA5426 TaxID=2682985 RepID=UPI00352FF6D5